MKIDQRVSNRYYAVYFIAACIVISIHCAIEMPSGRSFQDFYLKFGTKWAVPFFFLMSGAFFRKSYSNTFGGFRAACAGRFRGLVIPYLLWCLIGFCMRIPLILDHLSNMGLGGLVLAVFGVDRQFPMGNGVLWFLRSLILIQYGFLLLLGCVSREKKLRRLCQSVGVGMLLAAFLSRPSLHACIAQFGNPSAPVYFLLGYFGSNFLLRSIDKRLKWLLLSIGLIYMAFYLLIGANDRALLRHISNVALFFILCSFVDCLGACVSGWPRCTFFIYCFHRVPVEYGGMLMKKSWMYNLDVGYVLFVAVAVMVSLCMATATRKWMPGLYALLNGGRG